MQAQLVDDSKRDFVLDLEDVADRPIEIPRPDGQAVARANELHVDPERVARTQDRAVDQVIDTEPWADVARVARAFREEQCRGSRADRETVDDRQIPDELAGQTVRERIAGRVVAQIREWQHRDWNCVLAVKRPPRRAAEHDRRAESRDEQPVRSCAVRGGRSVELVGFCDA